MKMRLPRLLVSALLLLSCGLSSATQVRDPVRSPRLTELARSLSAGESGALANFWSEVERTHTPLIEALPGTPGETLMTFLVRADHEISTSVYASFVDLSEAAPGQLTRLVGSDVWYRSYQLSDQARFRYYLVWPQGRKPDARAAWREVRRGIAYEFFADPLNPKWFPVQDVNDVDRVSYAEGPKAPPEPFVPQRPGVGRGKVTTTDFESVILGNRRKISVYTPPRYDRTAAACDFLLLFDREQYLTSIPTPTILDNMIADGAIPPVIAVLVGNIDDPTRSAELPPNPKFQQFLRDELIPWVRERYQVTSDPKRSVVAGASYGGIGAAYTGFMHSDIFGNVLSQSGAYFWWPGFRDYGQELTSESGWLQRQFATSAKRPLRLYLDAGTWENAGTLLTNRHFHDLLRTMGYEANYREYVGGHEYIMWRSTLSDGLRMLLGTITAPQATCNPAR